MDRQEEERQRGVIITCDSIWLNMPANPEKEPLSIIICEHVDSGKRTTTERLLFELGGIPERELDKLTQEAERLEKSSLVFTFYMDRQKEEWERGVNIACSTKESFTDKWHCTIIDTPGHRDFIKNTITGTSQADAALIMVPADGKFTAANAKGYYSAREIQGQTRQHSRSSNLLLEMKQIYNDVNKMDCDTASYEQEWIRFASSVTAVSNDTWIQSNKVEANFCCFHRISVFGVRFLMVENRFPQDTSQDVSQEMWQTQAAHQSKKNIMYATITSSSSRTTTSSCLPLRYMRRLPLSLKRCLKRTT